MAKSPIKWNRTAVSELGQVTSLGAIGGAAVGATDPLSMVAGAAGGAIIGGAAGIVEAYRSKKKAQKNRNLNQNQFKG